METQKRLFDYSNGDFNWHNYNLSQTKEKIVFLRLLKELCDTLPDQYSIRRPKPVNLRNILFALCLKSYCQKSGRRIIGELELCKKSGLVSNVNHFNSLFLYLNKPELTPILQELIRLSSMPLRSIEKKFACDATGFGLSIMDDRWIQIRSRYEKHHKYMKAHISFGVLTNIVTHCIITNGSENDSPYLKDLVEETSKGFKIEEWSADKGYISRLNLEAVFEKGGIPYIPFKSNASRKARGSTIWVQMYDMFKNRNEQFMKSYHLRSNSESGFFMIKSRFGDITNMRKEVSARNDILCKVLCHNLCVLCQEIFLLGIEFNFAQLSKELAQGQK